MIESNDKSAEKQKTKAKEGKLSLHIIINSQKLFNSLFIDQNRLIFFSDYGYVKVKRDEYENTKNDYVHISNQRGDLLGKIKKSNLSNTIKVNLKTLYGERTLHTFTVNINEKLSVLVERLLIEEAKMKSDKFEKFEKINEKSEKLELTQKKRWQKNYQYRIISSIGSIKELDTHKSFIELSIKSNQTLVLADPEKIYFSEYSHGPGIILENNMSSAYKQTGDEQQYAFINKGFCSGRWYFEFLLETEPDEQNIILGVSLARKDFFYSTDCKNFWGFVPSL
jgi:hypothetical protein